MRRRACFFVASAVNACTLFTDLDGLQGGDEPNEAGTPARDVQSSGDAPTSDAAVTDAAYAPKFRRAITVENRAQTTIPAEYTFCFDQAVLDASKTRSDFGDVRVFGLNGTERPRLVERHVDGSIHVCFRFERAIPIGMSDTYEERYGDPATPPPAVDPATLFSFYDGFDGSTLSAKWAALGAPKVANGVLVLPKGGDNGVRTIAATDGIDSSASLELRVRVVDPSSPPRDGSVFYYWFGFQRKSDFVAESPWTLFIAREIGTIRAEHRLGGESVPPEAGPCAMTCASSFGLQTSQFRVYRIDRGGGQNEFSLEGQPFSAPGDNGDLGILLRSSLATSDVEVDWVRARAIVVPEPSVTVGGETPL